MEPNFTVPLRTLKGSNVAPICRFRIDIAGAKSTVRHRGSPMDMYRLSCHERRTCNFVIA